MSPRRTVVPFVSAIASSRPLCEGALSEQRPRSLTIPLGSGKICRYSRNRTLCDCHDVTQRMHGRTRFGATKGRLAGVLSVGGKVPSEGQSRSQFRTCSRTLF